jgi:hypothetical protein
MEDTPRRWSIRARASEEDGVTLVEVLVAITLLVTAMMALAQVATSGMLSVRSATDRTTAVSLATQSLDATRQIDWTQLSLDAGDFSGTCGANFTIDDGGAVVEPVVCAPDGAVADDLPFWGFDGAYELETFVTSVPGVPNARRVTALVSWNEGQTQREYRASTVIAQVDRG